NEPMDEEYTPVEKEPVVLDNIPLGGSFGFESEAPKVNTTMEETMVKLRQKASMAKIAVDNNPSLKNQNTNTQENIVELRQKASSATIAIDDKSDFKNSDTNTQENIVELRQKASNATIAIEKPIVNTTVEEATKNTPVNSNPVAMGGSFGFGGNEPMDEEYAPVKKEPVVLDNIPLGGSFGFESEDNN
ncbi:MAG: hypothetical protein UHY68_03645, partial [Acutalibacteraceae bacterium]|nr:hypothetical protein [Acutalibacteraceae bacterium]